ncbi:MAG: hypothetical protein Q9211_005511 [Gyalolechia sp. 1 TL-2023]
MVGHGSTSLLNGFKNVDLLQIMPGMDEGTPQAACEFFRAHPEIQHLVLRFGNMGPVHNAERKQNAAQIRDGDLKSFFTGLNPSTFCLRTLNLSHVDLRGCHCGWISAISLDVLSDLTLLNCFHPQDFLKAVRNATKKSPLHLEGFTLYQSQLWNPHPDTTPNPLMGEVNQFLRAITKSLRDPSICLRGFDEVPDAACIAQHGKTLKYLFIDVRKQKGPDITTYCIAEWLMLCRSLAKVRQVDVVYPSVEADCRIRDHKEFHGYVRATANIPTLKFLGVNNWPFPMRMGLVPTGPRATHTAYRHLLAGLATDILALSKSGLVGIVFGLQERITGQRNHGYGLSPIHFGRSRVELLGGELKMKMEPVNGWTLDKHTDLERKVFDIDGLVHDVGLFEAEHGR